MQWISERNAGLKEFLANGDFKTREDFLGLMALVVKNSPGLITTLAEDLTASSESWELESLREFARQQAGHLFDPDMLLTAACAWALGRSPHLATWLKIRLIANNSWQIENWLAEAMSAVAQKDAEARKAYVALALQLFKALESGELKSELDRKNEAREGAWSYWQAAKYPLEEIWWGFRGYDCMNYEEEMEIFGLLDEIAPTEFQKLIAGSTNPFLVDAALLSAGVGASNPRFSMWEKCVKLAPIAFAQDGSWRGSVLLPLLLVRARNELLKTCSQVSRYNADEIEVTTLTAEVISLIQAVVDVLTRREDAKVTLVRWGTWLMRQLLSSKQKDFSDIRSPGFVDNALLEAMGKAMNGLPSILDVPQDAAPWEDWCYRCVLSSYARDGIIDAPAFQKFADLWGLSPEDWHERKGRCLVEQAQLHIPSDDLPGLSAHLLVFPLAARDDFASGWQRLWDSAYYLREVLEFDSTDAGTESYSDQVEASRLLLLLGCMGLACFDHVAGRLMASEERLAEKMITLHKVLAAAAMEVLHIDSTIHRDKWRALLHHVALRRVYWDSRFIIGDRVAVFAWQSEPTIQDYLDYLQADPVDLVAFLHACMLNKLDASTLRDELRNTSVDLHACVGTLKRLNRLWDHRYPINGLALRAIEPLMEHSTL